MNISSKTEIFSKIFWGVDLGPRCIRFMKKNKSSIISCQFPFKLNLFLLIMQHNGSILSLQLKSSSGDGGERLLWDLSDTSLFAHDTWMVGQVHIGGIHQIFFLSRRGIRQPFWISVDCSIFSSTSEIVDRKFIQMKPT